MNEIVFIGNGQVLTNSRLVAHKFEKDHSKVLKAIRDLDCSQEFTKSNFGLSEYKDTTGRSLPEYVLTKDGFTFLVMGFTGSKAAKFKEDYIKAFNEMGQQLKPKSNLDLMEMAIKELRANEQRISKAEDRIEVLEAKSSTRPDYFTIAGYGNLIGKKVPADLAKKLGKEASKICRDREILTEFTPDPKFGKVKTYPSEILDEVFTSPSL